MGCRMSLERLLCVLALMLAGGLAQGEAENFAGQARLSASGEYPGHPVVLAVDGNLSTAWSAPAGAVRDQWFELDWDTTHTLGGVVLQQAGPYLDSAQVQVRQGGAWVTVGRPGASHEALPLRVAVPFPSCATRAMRLAALNSSTNGVAFSEIEVYADQAKVQAVAEGQNRLTIAAAGDLLGHLVGSVSRGEGVLPVAPAEVTVAGQSPLGDWSRAARTDAEGMFQIDLPAVLTGAVKLAARADGRTTELELQAGEIAQALTPRPDGPAALKLDGTWDFLPDPPADFLECADALQWRPIRVPGHWEVEGFRAESGRGLYRKRFMVPGEWAGKRIKLRAESICSRAQAWCNGQRVGGHVGGATPFELDLSQAARPEAANTLLVLVDENSPAKALDSLSYYADYHLAGIWRPIEVFAVEPAHVRRLAVATDFDARYCDADLLVDVTLLNEQAEAVPRARLILTLRGPDRQPVATDGLTTTVALGPWAARSLRLKAHVTRPVPWNAEQPRLYTLQGELQSGARPVARTALRLGFREIEIDGPVCKLNGRPVKFWGSCHHDAHPLRGRAVDENLIRQDLELMKAGTLGARSWTGPMNWTTMPGAPMTFAPSSATFTRPA